MKKHEIKKPNGQVYAKVWREDGMLRLVLAQYDPDLVIQMDEKVIPQLLSILRAETPDEPEQEPVAAHQALEALDELESCARGDEPFNHFAAPLIRQFIEQALAQPEQEPVAWFVQYEDSHEFVWSKPDGWRVKQALEIQPLYDASPKKEWVELAKEDMPDGDNPMFDTNEFYAGMAWAAAKLKEKNNG